jgi:ATP-dependent helicase/nuclease subunit B
MALRDWLPILEAGLARLSVGVIPPVLDQVLIGSIDRSRNPELKLAPLLGVNETVFPATPPAGHLLGEADREELAAREVRLGHGRREFLSRERFLGYIACTRARQRLVVTCAQQDNDGGALNPSPFFAHLHRLFSKLPVEKFAPPDWREAGHLSELAGQLARAGDHAPILSELLRRPAFASLREQMASFASVTEPRRLEPEQAAQLYGTALRTSVSRLEEFAACSFKFFVRSGLRAEERERFELDVRERGSFQHEALAVVVDYKSSARKLDKIMMAHGLHLQLPAYLSVLRHLGDARKIFGVGRLAPAGGFLCQFARPIRARRHAAGDFAKAGAIPAKALSALGAV